MPGLDAFLHHLPAADDDIEELGPEDPTRAPSERIPVLVRLPIQALAQFEAPEGFREDTRVGNILSGAGTREALAALAAIDGVVVEVSRNVNEERAWELDVSTVTVRGQDVAAPAGEAETQCLVGLIDGGIDVRHQAFLGADGVCRVLCVWDQTSDAGDNPDTALGIKLQYGTVHTAEDIAQALDKKEDLPGLSEMTSLGMRHGTHVASIAAGRRAANHAQDPTVFSGGMAPDAPIIVVIPKLEAKEGDPRSIGYSKGHVDALRFIEEVATQRGFQAIVVNLSAGMSAGAHDGSSTLEAAFDAFTQGGRAPGRAIVKSAGNARVDQKHASIQVSRGMVHDVSITPMAGAAEKDPVVVEAWFSSADEVEIVVVDANQLHAPPCSPSAPRPAKCEMKGGPVHRSYERFHPDNGESQLLVTLPAGAAFTVSFKGLERRSDGKVELWLEGSASFAESETERTLTVPGTARTVITVAASDRRGNVINKSSSTGPTRDNRPKPEIHAPGNEVRAARSGAGDGVVTFTGTSMAAPHVAGAIARLFSMHVRLKKPVPNAVQTRAALIASAQNFDGRFNPETGFGLLDAKGLIDSFASWRK